MKKNNFLNIFISAIICLLMLQRILISSFPVFKYLDEFVLVIFFCLFLARTLKRKKIYKEDIKVLIIIILMIILGLLGNKYSGYSRNVNLIIEAILFWFKSFFIFLFAYSFFDDESFNSNKIIIYVSKIVKIVVVLAFIGLLISPITKFGLDMDFYQMRYGIHPYGFIYPKPAIFSWYCVLFMLILTAENAISNKNNMFFLIITSIVWLFTLRSRAFVYIILYWFLFVWMFNFSKKKILKIKLRHIIIIGVIAFSIALPALQKYFVRSNASRAILLRTGINIGVRYFPLGAGFANYGTTPSYKNYSDLYYYYGFDKIYALKYVEGSSNEITDSYWPAIVGEMGFFGLIFMACLIIIMIKRLIIKSKLDKWTYLSILFFALTSLFSSIATPVFSEDIMIGYMIVVILTCYIKPLNSNRV